MRGPKIKVGALITVLKDGRVLKVGHVEGESITAMDPYEYGIAGCYVWLFKRKEIRRATRKEVGNYIAIKQKVGPNTKVLFTESVDN